MIEQLKLQGIPLYIRMVVEMLKLSLTGQSIYYIKEKIYWFTLHTLNPHALDCKILPNTWIKFRQTSLHISNHKYSAY
jgi:hypothetical protein